MVVITPRATKEKRPDQKSSSYYMPSMLSRKTPDTTVAKFLRGYKPPAEKFSRTTRAGEIAFSGHDCMCAMQRAQQRLPCKPRNRPDPHTAADYSLQALICRAPPAIVRRCKIIISDKNYSFLLAP
jgi:hypothetical protein